MKCPSVWAGLYDTSEERNLTLYV